MDPTDKTNTFLQNWTSISWWWHIRNKRPNILTFYKYSLCRGFYCKKIIVYDHIRCRITDVRYMVSFPFNPLMNVHFEMQFELITNSILVKLTFTISTEIYGFFDYFQWSHGSNLTISILLHSMLMLHHIPDVLYLQMDNCPGQNKNRYIYLHNNKI